MRSIPLLTANRRFNLAGRSSRILLVLDILMPVMDGFEVLRHLRAFSKIPVIVMTARQARTRKRCHLALMITW